MTEIIKNNKSISLDIIDTGTSVAKSMENNPKFNSVYSNLDSAAINTIKKNELSMDEGEIEKNISEIN